MKKESYFFLFFLYDIFNTLKFFYFDINYRLSVHIFKNLIQVLLYQGLDAVREIINGSIFQNI